MILLYGFGNYNESAHTRKAPIEGFVRIGTERDAADASFATIIGDAMLTSMAVWAEETEAQVAVPLETTIRQKIINV